MCADSSRSSVRRRTPDEPPELERFADVAAGLATADRGGRARARRDGWLARPESATWSTRAESPSTVSANARLEREARFDRSLSSARPTMPARRSGLRSTLRTRGRDARARGRLAASRAHSVSRACRMMTLRSTPRSRGRAFGREVDDPAGVAASLLADGQIVGWFQGRIEFGPRALGNRSLLADPRRAEFAMSSIAASSTASRSGRSARRSGRRCRDWFACPRRPAGAASCRDLMILAYPVRPDRASLIPAVVHHDGTCRVQVVDARQNPLFHALIRRFRELTGVPLVLNTSFNDQEPLVATPDDALEDVRADRIDALFLGDRLVRRAR